MSETAAGFSGDSYQESDRAAGAKRVFPNRRAFVLKGHTVTFRQLRVSCLFLRQIIMFMN